MSWARGVNTDGRDIGYGVLATCDQGGCPEEIDRGLAYVCGGMHDGGRYGCGGYFCPQHLRIAFNDSDEMSPILCNDCLTRWLTS